MATTLDINGKSVAVSAAPETPLLWVLRDEAGLTGSKFGCGIGQCGACTVLADGSPIRSCSVPIASLAGVKIATIESLGGTHALQQAWVKHDVPQCGYCQSGQLMSRGPAGDQPQAFRRRHRRRHGWQYLPLWRLSAHSRCHQRRRRSR
jgi:isoquinoline 1-oxidoreductase subunit alpha